MALSGRMERAALLLRLQIVRMMARWWQWQRMFDCYFESLVQSNANAEGTWEVVIIANWSCAWRMVWIWMVQRCYTRTRRPGRCRIVGFNARPFLFLFYVIFGGKVEYPRKILRELLHRWTVSYLPRNNFFLACNGVRFHRFGKYWWVRIQPILIYFCYVSYLIKACSYLYSVDIQSKN